MHMQYLKSIFLAAFLASPLSATRDPGEPGLCFSNPSPRWNANVAYNISTTFQKGLCQMSVRFSDDRFPVLFYTTTQASDECEQGEVNQIQLPIQVPNGRATIEQTCVWSTESLCVSISIEGGESDPSVFTESGHYTVERLCAKGTTVTGIDTALASPTQSADPQASQSKDPEDSLLEPTNSEKRTETSIASLTSSRTDDSLDRRLPEQSSSSIWSSAPITTLVTSTTKSSNNPPSETTSYLIPRTHIVRLDYSQKAFNPNQVNATVGDVVQFLFLSPGHSIIETSLQFPCNAEPEGFESGDDTNPGRNFNNSVSFTVARLNPRYFACGELDHCLNGMVFAVNADPTRFSQFVGNIKSSSTTSASATRVSALNTISVDNEMVPTVCSVCPTTVSMPSESTAL